MRASTKRILSILLSGVFLIALIVVSTTLIKPEFDRVMEKRALLFSKQSLLQNQQNAVSQVQELINTFQNFDTLQSTVSLALPTEENNTLMLNQITAISRNAGVSIESYETFSNSFEDAEESLTQRLGSTETSIIVTGEYSDVKNFVNLLETNVRIFNVKEINLSPVFEEGVGRIVEGEITFNSYFQDSN